MKKVLYLEFYEEPTLEEIYKELIFFHQKKIPAEYKYKEITLSNMDIEKLRDTITRLELGLNEEEYEQYKKHEHKNHEQFKIYCARNSTPYIIRYWITKASEVLEEVKKEEWEMYCYDLIRSAYEKDDIQKELLNSYYKAIISASKIIVALFKYKHNFQKNDLIKVIDEEFSNITNDFEMNEKFLFIDSAVSKFTDVYSLSDYRKYTYFEQIMDKDKYSNLKENPITKKRIPDYLRIKH